MYIKQESIDRIYSAVVIEDVIGQFVDLKKTGSNYRGPSPFNNEKTPSFYVVPSKQIYKDFSSGNGGNVIDFLMRKENLTYPQALQWLADKYKIALEFERDESSPEQREERKNKLEMADNTLRLASKLYRESRNDERLNPIWTAYIAKRHWDEDTILKWGIGIAGTDWDVLSSQVIKHELYGIAEEIGLVKAKESGGAYDVLRARFTFEIHDNASRLVGIAGRDYSTELPDADPNRKPPKYVNPKESLIYHKERVLYGWRYAHAEIKKSGMCYLVEGYTDVIAMHSIGIENTVASCGTSVTEHQLRSIARLNASVCIVMEDKAGIKAAMRTIQLAMKLGIETYVVDISINGDKRDPDQYVIESIEEGKSHEDIRLIFENKRTNGVRWFADQTCQITMEGARGKQEVTDIFYKLLAQVPESKNILFEEWASALSGSMACFVIEPHRDNAIKALSDEYQERKAKLEKRLHELHVQGNNADEAGQKKLRVEIDRIRKQIIKEEDAHGAAAKKELKVWEKRMDAHSPTWKELMKMATAERKEEEEKTKSKKSKYIPGTGDDDLEFVTDQEVIDMLGEDNALPNWIKKEIKGFRNDGMIQLIDKEGSYKVGMYFPEVEKHSPNYRTAQRCTNFTITPLYHIVDMKESHRMVEIKNDRNELKIIELSDTELASMDSFIKLLNRIGYFYVEPWFGKYHFMKMSAFIKRNTVRCGELKFLGWNNKGFWAFSNKIVVPTESGLEKCEYDEHGIVKVEDKFFLSPSIAASRTDDDDFTGEGSSYEDEKYLQYVESPLTFAEWAKLFHTCYGDKGRIGIVVLLMATFRDLIYQKQLKCPHLYCFGPPQSGKSAMAESIMRVFFAGKNANGQLINGVAMSDGTVTDFALSDSLQRYSNTARLYNEYDPNKTNAKYPGWFKNAYDGEGRKRGTVAEGRKRTETMHVRSLIMLAGQYPDQTDACALMTRCLNLAFNEFDIKGKTTDQVAAFNRLKDYEGEGLSSIVCEVVRWRGRVSEILKDEFIQAKNELLEKSNSLGGGKPEVRLWENYALAVAFARIFDRLIELPFSTADFFQYCLSEMKNYSAMVIKSGVVNAFWNVIMDMAISKRLLSGVHYTVGVPMELTLKVNGENIRTVNGTASKMLFIRLSVCVSEYQKEQRSKGVHAFNEAEIDMYLRNQPYYVGLTPYHYFKPSDGKEGFQTSAVVINYDELVRTGVSLVNDHTSVGGTAESQAPQSVESEDELPF